MANGNASEDRCPRVDRYSVFDDWVARHPLAWVAVAVERKAFRAQGDALVEFHVVADDRGFADYDASAVVDEKVGADLRSGVDVDTRLGVR